jgi:hypothetical protein
LEGSLLLFRLLARLHHGVPEQQQQQQQYPCTQQQQQQQQQQQVGAAPFAHYLAAAIKAQRAQGSSCSAAEALQRAAGNLAALQAFLNPVCAVVVAAAPAGGSAVPAQAQQCGGEGSTAEQQLVSAADAASVTDLRSVLQQAAAHASSSGRPTDMMHTVRRCAAPCTQAVYV